MHEYKELTAVKMVTLCIAVVVLLLLLVLSVTLQSKDEKTNQKNTAALH